MLTIHWIGITLSAAMLGAAVSDIVAAGQRERIRFDDL
jgi:hypothetical protein